MIKIHKYKIIKVNKYKFNNYNKIQTKYKENLIFIKRITKKK